MLLERLKEYAERLGDAVPPPGYEKTAIKWIVPLDASGQAGPLIPTMGREGKYDRGKEYLAPHRLRTSTAIRPKLLADNAEYVLGKSRSGVASGRQRKRIDQCHQAFVELVRDCAAKTQEATVQRVLGFLERAEFKLDLPEQFDASHNITFQVDGILPIHLRTVQEFWAKYFWDAVLAGEEGDEEGESESRIEVSASASEVRAREMECIVCGKITAPVLRHPFQIKGIPGRRAGAALISANSTSFESYGLKASLIAPTCRDCADVYVKAANLLIQGDSTSISVGPCTYMFWTKEDSGFLVASLLSNPQPDEVKALIKAVFTTKREAATLDTTPFYAVALTANRSRVVVRDWLETTVQRVQEAIARWFQSQSIVGEWGETDALPFPIQSYWKKETKQWVEGLSECVLPKIKKARNIKELNPQIPALLLNVALKGGSLPKWILYQAVQRNRSEQTITRCRAALIKMVLLSQGETFLKEGAMAQLETENHQPAYLCGRLLAVLEGIQRTAIPGVKATITDRFFGTASSAPASVFGHLIRGAMAHLSKLRKEKPGTYEALSRKLSELQAPLKTFPKTLTLEQQGLFGLGYFHQQAADRAAVVAYRQSREN
jgi:CRISPR-associated protein Csd1